MVDTGLGAHGAEGKGTRTVRKGAGAAQPPRLAVGRPGAGERRVVGQLPADVQHGGTDPVRNPAQYSLGRSLLMAEKMSDHYLAALDIGGTKIAASIADRSGPLLRLTQATPLVGSPRTLAEQCIGLIE